MTVLANGHLLFMGSLDVTSVPGLNDRRLYLSNMHLHDATRDLVMVNQFRLSEIKQK